MKALFGEIVAMTFFVIVILSAGCTAGDTPAPLTGNVSAAAPAMTPGIAGTVTPLPTTPGCAYPPLNPWTWIPESYQPAGPVSTKLPQAPGTPVSKADLFGTPSLRWDEYEYSQQIRGLPDSYGTSRMEKSKEDSPGKSVIHENHTYGLHPPGESRKLWDFTMDDMYYDEYGNMVSLHRRVIRNGEFLENRDYPPVAMNKGTPDCSGAIFEPRYTFIGNEPVTVPAGTYPGAMKYVENNDDDPVGKTSTETFWFAPGVPVPVRSMIEDREKGLSFTYELKDWG